MSEQIIPVGVKMNNSKSIGHHLGYYTVHNTNILRLSAHVTLIRASVYNLSYCLRQDDLNVFVDSTVRM